MEDRSILQMTPGRGSGKQVSRGICQQREETPRILVLEAVQFLELALQAGIRMGVKRGVS